MTNSYNYANRAGIHPISWEDMHGICKALAAAAAPFRPELILAVGRGGYYPGTLLAHLLQTDIVPVRLSRRVNDVVTHERPQWLVEPPALVANRRILIVDEICASGETLTIVKERVTALGAAETRTAVLYAHTWDREIFKDGRFIVHPEYAEALRQQRTEPDASLFIPATPIELAKGRDGPD